MIRGRGVTGAPNVIDDVMRAPNGIGLRTDGVVTTPPRPTRSIVGDASPTHVHIGEVMCDTSTPLDLRGSSSSSSSELLGRGHRTKVQSCKLRDFVTHTVV